MVISIQLALNRKTRCRFAAAYSPHFSAQSLRQSLCQFWYRARGQPVPHDAWPYIALLILCGSINQTLLVFAFAHADASTLAPFTYFEIVSAVRFLVIYFSVHYRLQYPGQVFY